MPKSKSIILFTMLLRYIYPLPQARTATSKIFHYNIQPLSATSMPFDDRNFISKADKIENIPPEIKKEIQQLKLSVQNLDKYLDISSSTKPKENTWKFVAVTKDTLELNVRTVETYSIMSFFFIGSIIGGSLSHRLWLIGGIIMAWWAADAVQKDTGAGMVTRYVGVISAQLIRDIKDLCQQIVAMILSQPGKLTSTSSQAWEQMKFGIHQRVNRLPELVGIQFVLLTQDIKKESQKATGHLGFISSNCWFGIQNFMGSFTRLIGAQMVELIQNIQDTYQRALMTISSHRIGKPTQSRSKSWKRLSFWEQCDLKFGIQKRVNSFKTNGMWQFVANARQALQRFDNHWGISSTLWNLGAGAVKRQLDKAIHGRRINPSLAQLSALSLAVSAPSRQPDTQEATPLRNSHNRAADG